MRVKKLTVVVVSSVGLALLLGGRILAADAGPGPDRDTGSQAEADRPQPPGPPGGPAMGRRRPPGAQPGGRRGPGGGFGRRGPPQMRPAGPPSEGGANRPGRPDRPGPRSPGHPGGPPRWPHHNWENLQKNEPEMYKLLVAERDLERQERELSIQYRRAPGPQRAAVKAELKELVGKHFEVRQQRRMLELKGLEKELRRLREAIDRRNEARDALVGKRITQLIGEDDIDF